MSYCSHCGELLEDGAFCSACGAPVDETESPDIVPETSHSSTQKITKEITLGEDGVYRWAYDLNLYKNPTILFVLWKIFGCIMGGMYLLLTLLSVGDHGFWFDGFLEQTKAFALLTLGILVLTLVGYLVYAVYIGGKYCVLFEMDEKGVRHTQIDKQFKKAQVMSAISMLSAQNASGMGSAILAGTKSSMYSEWRVVRSVISYPRLNVIKVNGLLDKNQVYADDADFEFVKGYIVNHCKNAKISER